MRAVGLLHGIELRGNELRRNETRPVVFCASRSSVTRSGALNHTWGRCPLGLVRDPTGGQVTCIVSGVVSLRCIVLVIRD